MIARRNPDGDSPIWRRLLIEAKCIVKRRIAKPGIPVEAPELPYLVVPILGQSNAFGMGLPLDPTGLDRAHPSVHQWAMCGPSKGTVVLGVDPLFHEIPCKRVGFGVTFAKRLADDTGRAVLLIPGARGDTSFTPKNGHTWDGNDRSTRVNLYRQAVNAIDAALARMVPEEMELSGKPYAGINAVHEDTPNRRQRTAFVPGPRESFNSAADRHYNAAGLRELGERMWSAYSAMCSDALTLYRGGAERNG
jgi:hypothetical protein